jgi:hypothetical protein
MSGAQRCDRAELINRCAKLLSQTLDLVSDLGSELESVKDFDKLQPLVEYLSKLYAAEVRLGTCKMLIIEATPNFVLNQAMEALSNEWSVSEE